MSGRSIRVVVFDDNKDLRDMFRMLVDAQPDMVCAAAHADLSQMMRDLDAARPDVIVMDIQMPGMNGIEGVAAIKVRWPEARILMQTVFDDDEKVFSAIRAGASGYILKTTSVEEMAKAIRDVHAGGSAMSPAIAFKVLEHFRANASPAEKRDVSLLSEREQDVLVQLVKGRSYKMIADALGISYHTVDSHIRKIYEKLHVHNTAEAVSKAVREGLVK